VSYFNYITTIDTHSAVSYGSIHIYTKIFIIMQHWSEKVVMFKLSVLNSC